MHGGCPCASRGPYHHVTRGCAITCPNDALPAGRTISTIWRSACIASCARTAQTSSSSVWAIPSSASCQWTGCTSSKLFCLSRRPTPRAFTCPTTPPSSGVEIGAMRTRASRPNAQSATFWPRGVGRAVTAEPRLRSVALSLLTSDDDALVLAHSRAVARAAVGPECCGRKRATTRARFHGSGTVLSHQLVEPMRNGRLTLCGAPGVAGAEAPETRQRHTPRGARLARAVSRRAPGFLTLTS